MTADQPYPRVRVRKARRSSTLSCQHYVQIGQQIVHVHGQWWCMKCAMVHLQPFRAQLAATGTK